MNNVLIYGAGSIGNHLCYACRRKGWHVSIVDIDKAALRRTREEIYPSRYGSWDDNITLSTKPSLSKHYDLVVIGTPPDTHTKLALDVLSGDVPRVLLIEKPLSDPDLDSLVDLRRSNNNSRCKILVGYNHNLTRNTIRAGQIIKRGLLGKPLSIHVRWKEHWGGIFSAHPWLSGPEDSYLGFVERGGGACAEHSHAISLWQHFSDLLGTGRISKVSAMMDIVDNDKVNYDRSAYLFLETENNLTGSVIQDVVTKPAEKILRLQGSEGFLEWFSNYDESNDAIIYGSGDNDVTIEKFQKTRPDDFSGEVDHIEKLLTGVEDCSPVSFLHGMGTMLVIAAAHASRLVERPMNLDYKRCTFHSGK